MDNDALMIKSMSNALIDLQVKYRAASVTDRMQIKPALDDLLQKFSKFQIALLKEGTITTDSDMAEMAQLKKDVDAAANKQQMIAAIAKAAAFIVKKL